jgi:hypothetical protein
MAQAVMDGDQEVIESISEALQTASAEQTINTNQEIT